MNLHETMNALDWAREFLRIKNEQKFTINEDLMLPWFANAIMCGYDHANYKKQDLISELQNIKEIQGSHGNWNYDPYMQGLYNGLEMGKDLLE